MVVVAAMVATGPPVVRAVKVAQAKVSSVARDMAATAAVQEPPAMAATEVPAAAMVATVAIPEHQAPAGAQAPLVAQE